SLVQLRWLPTRPSSDLSAHRWRARPASHLHSNRFPPPMDLNYSPEEVAFRDEVRAFLREQLPGDISRKVLEHRRLGKDDYVRWRSEEHTSEIQSRENLV